MKIVTVIGARPQFIKAAVVSMRFRAEQGIEELLIHTGQHFDENMSQVFFDQMQIPEPAVHLGVNNMDHGAMTGKMLEGIEQVLKKESPDMVLVYGDTNSTLAGALAASKLHIPLAHVEAGLRSFDMKMPEEINRILTDRVASILFCPTKQAVENLKREGFEHFDCEVIKTGDVMQDAALHFSAIAETDSTIIHDMKLDNFVLATVHRAENTDDPNRLSDIVSALNKINEEVKVLMPLHPRTRKLLDKHRISPKFSVIDPVGYLDMIQLIAHAALIMTDSGGLQKEAYFFEKHCVTLREQTEWIELVEGGYNVIVGTSSDKIYKAYQEMIGKSSDFSVDLYGNGQAARSIVDTLVSKTKTINS